MSKRKNPGVDNHASINKISPIQRIQYQADIDDTDAYDKFCDLDISDAQKRFTQSASTDNLLSMSSIQLISKSFSKYRHYENTLRTAYIDTIFWNCHICNETFRVSWTGRREGRKGHFRSIEIIKHCTKCVNNSQLKRNYRTQCQASANNTQAFKEWCRIDVADASNRFNNSLTHNLLAEFSAFDRSQIHLITKSFRKYTGTDIDSRKANVDVIFWTCPKCEVGYRLSWTGRKNENKGHFRCISIIEHIKKCTTNPRRAVSHVPHRCHFESSWPTIGNTPPVPEVFLDLPVSHDPTVPALPVTAFEHLPSFDAAKVHANTSYKPSHITKFREIVAACHSSTPNISQHAISIHTPLPVISVPEHHPFRNVYVRIASLPNPPYSIVPPAPKMPVVRRCSQTKGDAVSIDQNTRQDVVPLLMDCNKFPLYQHVCVNEHLVVGLDTIITSDIFDKYMFFADTTASTDAFFQFYSNSYYRTNTLQIGYGVTSSVYEVRKKCDDPTTYVVKVFTGDFMLFSIVKEVVSLLTFRYIYMIHNANERIDQLYICIVVNIYQLYICIVCLQ